MPLTSWPSHVRAYALRPSAAGSEAERIRIAREIHDGVLQDLHTLRLGLAADGDAAREAGVLHVIRSLRRTLQDLRPPDLDHYDLADALQALVDRFRDVHPDVQLDFDLRITDGTFGGYGRDVLLALYRVVQETLHNAGKHAGATIVSVWLDATDEAYHLNVSDDGVGFCTETASPGFGMMGMRERAEAVAAHLAIRSAPGAGTHLEMSGPARTPPVL